MKEFLWHQNSTTEAVYETKHLPRGPGRFVVCTGTLIITSGAQTGSSAKHAFTPDAIPYGPAP